MTIYYNWSITSHLRLYNVPLGDENHIDRLSDILSYKIKKPNNLKYIELLSLLYEITLTFEIHFSTSS